MCDINAILIDNGAEQIILENVEDVETLENGEMRLTNIFGEVRTVNARLKSFHNSQKKMILIPMPG